MKMIFKAAMVFVGIVAFSLETIPCTVAKLVSTPKAVKKEVKVEPIKTLEVNTWNLATRFNF